MAYVSKYTSQQANILKCSILMTAGGLMEDKIVAAYKAVDDQANDKREATFMTILALDEPSVPAAYSTAVEADAFCQKTGVPGLQYISGVVRIGSFMAKTMAAIAGATPIDFNDPTAVKNATNDLLAKCNSDPRDAACPSMEDLGASTTTLAQGIALRTMRILRFART